MDLHVSHIPAFRLIDDLDIDLVTADTADNARTTSRKVLVRLHSY